MLNSLDLLIIVSLGLIAASLLSLVLMFLIKNKTVKRVCFFLVAALSVYIGYVGFRINWPGFLGQVIVGVLAAAAGIAALVLETVAKDNEKLHKLARILVAAALVIGTANAFFI